MNLHKSKVHGIGVDNLEVNRLSSILKCKPASFPFIYLGLLVGANMKLAKNWNPVVEIQVAIASRMSFSFTRLQAPKGKSHTCPALLPGTWKPLSLATQEILRNVLE